MHTAVVRHNHFTSLSNSMQVIIGYGCFYVCFYACIFMYVYASIRMCMYLNLCLGTCMYVCIKVYVICVCILYRPTVCVIVVFLPPSNI